jgi:hypothetical protein
MSLVRVRKSGKGVSELESTVLMSDVLRFLAVFANVTHEVDKLLNGHVSEPSFQTSPMGHVASPVPQIWLLEGRWGYRS